MFYKKIYLYKLNYMEDRIYDFIVENYGLNREMDLIIGQNTTDKILGDREIFNKFSSIF